MRGLAADWANVLLHEARRRLGTRGDKLSSARAYLHTACKRQSGRQAQRRVVHGNVSAVGPYLRATQRRLNTPTCQLIESEAHDQIYVAGLPVR